MSPRSQASNDLPADLREYLPEQTADAWIKLAALVPSSGYLAGGTGLTVHLHHRISRDLDFMLQQPEDLPSLRRDIDRAGTFAVTHQDKSTLNGVFEDTRVQFMETTGQKIVGTLELVAGIRVASVEDIMAMKLKVIVDRGELRDYFDLMEIDQRGIIPLEEGLQLFLERYDPPNPDEYLTTIVKSLGYLDDVADDPALPVEKSAIEKFWSARQRSILRNLSRY